MTEDQKDKSLLLDLLAASHPLPRTPQWLADEMALAGRPRRDIHLLLRALVAAGLAAEHLDPLGVLRYTITPAGREAIDAR